MASAVQGAVASRSTPATLSADEAALSVATSHGSSGRLSKKIASAVIGALSIALWLSLWQLASVHKWNFFFRFENIPAPSEVFAAVGELYRAPKFAAHVGNSLRRIFLGFSVAPSCSGC